MSRVYTETTCQRCGKVERKEGAALPSFIPGWAAFTITLYGGDAQPLKQQESGDLCPSCTSEVLHFLGLVRKRQRRAVGSPLAEKIEQELAKPETYEQPNQAEADATSAQSQAEKDKGDLFGSSTTIGRFPDKKFRRLLRIRVSSCDLDSYPHDHQRQLDGSTVCLTGAYSTTLVVDGQLQTLTRGQALVIPTGDYSVEYEDVEECFWAIGPHRHRVQGLDVICLSTQEQVDAKAAALRAAIPSR